MWGYLNWKRTHFIHICHPEHLQIMYTQQFCWPLALLALYFVSPAWTSQSAWSISDVPSLERTQFKKLVANDPSHLDRFHTTNDPTTYEQLVSIGYNSSLNLLEATIEIKWSTGFDGELCTNGSHEYVRFYFNYGSDWQDIGISKLNTHDILGGRDCVKHRTKPLFYSIPIGFEPRQYSCATPVLPNIRAILSWEDPPPPSTPFFVPVWGNILDQHIQLPPLPQAELSSRSTYRQETWERPSRWDYIDSFQLHSHGTEGPSSNAKVSIPTTPSVSISLKKR